MVLGDTPSSDSMVKPPNSYLILTAAVLAWIAWILFFYALFTLGRVLYQIVYPILYPIINTVNIII